MQPNPDALVTFKRPVLPSTGSSRRVRPPGPWAEQRWVSGILGCRKPRSGQAQPPWPGILLRYETKFHKLS